MLVQAGQQVLAYAEKEEEGVLADRACQQAVAGARLLAIALMLPLAALCLRPVAHAGAQDSKDQPILCILKKQCKPWLIISIVYVCSLTFFFLNYYVPFPFT